MNQAPIIFEHVGLLGKYQASSALRGHNAQRLKARIEYERAQHR